MQRRLLPTRLRTPLQVDNANAFEMLKAAVFLTAFLAAIIWYASGGANPW